MRKEYQRLLNKFEMEGFMSEKGLWNLVREKVLRERGALPKGEGDVIREYNAMHEDNFLSWLRRDGKNKEETRLEMGKESTEGRGKRRRREGEKEENEAETVRRGCLGHISVEFFEICSQEEEDTEGCGECSRRNLLIILSLRFFHTTSASWNRHDRFRTLANTRDRTFHWAPRCLRVTSSESTRLCMKKDSWATGGGKMENKRKKCWWK